MSESEETLVEEVYVTPKCKSVDINTTSKDINLAPEPQDSANILPYESLDQTQEKISSKKAKRKKQPVTIDISCQKSATGSTAVASSSKKQPINKPECKESPSDDGSQENYSLLHDENLSLDEADSSIHPVMQPTEADNSTYYNVMLDEILNERKRALLESEEMIEFIQKHTKTSE